LLWGEGVGNIIGVGEPDDLDLFGVWSLAISLMIIYVVDTGLIIIEGFENQTWCHAA
jgi:hypothetical protein